MLSADPLPPGWPVKLVRPVSAGSGAAPAEPAPAAIPIAKPAPAFASLFEAPKPAEEPAEEPSPEPAQPKPPAPAPAYTRPPPASVVVKPADDLPAYFWSDVDKTEADAKVLANGPVDGTFLLRGKPPGSTDLKCVT